MQLQPTMRRYAAIKRLLAFSSHRQTISGLARALAISPLFTALSILVPATDARAQDALATRTFNAQANLAKTLISRVQSTDQDNAIVSPAGVAAAFALMDVGTSGWFRDAAHRVLGYNAERSAVDDFDDLRRQILLVNQAPSGASSIFFFANAAVLDPRLKAEPQVIERMRASKADVSVQPLSDHATVNSINAWVANSTNGLIPDIVDDNIKDAELIVLNALYFKDNWSVTFNKAQTRLAAFHGAVGTTTDVQMMRATMTSPFHSDGRFAAIDLRYQSARFSLTLVTTRDRPAAFSEFGGTMAWLSADQFEEMEVNVQLPRFVLRQAVNVLPALDAAGLASARQDSTAFAPMTSVAVDISGILQKVYLAINEQGTEAAAATSVVARSFTLRPTKSDSIAFDKPFVFALRDHLTGLILLSGYISRVPADSTQ
jgi:serine protease inhibitor